MIVGGIVPEPDIAKLKEAGIAAVLTPGATAEQIVAEVAAVLASRAVTPATCRSSAHQPDSAPWLLSLNIH